MIIDEQIFGYIAGALTMINNVPQAIKVLRTRNTRPISLTSYSLCIVCIILWLIYGFGLGDMVIIVTNLVILPFIMIILFKKIYNLKKGID